jgi:hypothetical protein
MTVVDHTDADRGSSGSGRTPEWPDRTGTAGSGETKSNSQRIERRTVGNGPFDLNKNGVHDRGDHPFDEYL